MKIIMMFPASPIANGFECGFHLNEAELRGENDYKHIERSYYSSEACVITVMFLQTAVRNFLIAIWYLILRAFLGDNR